MQGHSVRSSWTPRKLTPREIVRATDLESDALHPGRGTLSNHEACSTSPGGQHDVRFDPRDYRVERRFFSYNSEAQRVFGGDHYRVEIVRHVLSRAKAEEHCQHAAHCSRTNHDTYTSVIAGHWIDVAVPNTSAA